MKRIIKRAVAIAVMMSVLMITVSAIAVSWPSKTKSFAGVNTYLNALHATDASQLSRVKVVSAVLQSSGGSSMEGSVQCPGWSLTTTGWYATGGGFMHPDTTSADGDYFASMSGPTMQMGTNLPNGWKVNIANPTYNGTDPLPTDIMVYAVCAT